MVTWDEDPSFKIEAGAVDFSSDGLTLTIHRPENAISRVIISANDYDGKNYIANIDAFTVIKASLRYGAGAYTQVFEGRTEHVGPKLDNTQTLSLIAYGYGRALRNTHCSSNYGEESENPTLVNPEDVWDDLIANQINKSFGGAATQYGILDAKVAAITDPPIKFLEGGYRNNLTMINDVCLIYQGYRAGAAGIHWFVDESKNLFLNTIAAHENNATGWPTWWRTDQAGSTMVEVTDFLRTHFYKKTSNYANKIVLYCDLRKPGTDIWTEINGPVWGNDGLTSVGYSVTEFLVGTHSLECFDNGAGQGDAYYPGSSLLTGDAAAAQKVVAVTSVTGTPFRVGDTVRIWDNTPTTETGVIASIAGLNITLVDNLVNAYQVADAARCTRMAGWDFEKVGSPENPPTINFYFWKDSDFDETSSTLRLYTTDHDNDYYESPFSAWTEPDDEWIHRSLTIGPYWKSKDESRIERWVPSGGAEDWGNINGLSFYIIGQIGFAAYLYVDDLHFSGKIIREAYNSTKIAADQEVQKIIRYDVAVDDTLKASDARGTAGQLAYGELLTRQVIPTVGAIVTPLAIDALPGQLVYIKSDAHTPFGANDYRVRDTFRVKEVVHNFSSQGATTTWDVTSDTLNTFVPGFNDALSVYHKIMYTDPEMKNLRTTGLDPYVTRLSIDYP